MNEIEKFEIAAKNFGESCIHAAANEKSFQAWFVTFLIQEFGRGRIYREINFEIDTLFKLVANPSLTNRFKNTTELAADIAVSWEPDIDVRHYATRDEKDLKKFFKKFAIFSELKVTGSTKSRTSQQNLLKDLVRLAVYSLAHGNSAGEPDLQTYLILLDNHEARQPDVLKNLISDAKKELPEIVSGPKIIYIRPEGKKSKFELVRIFDLKDLS